MAVSDMGRTFFLSNVSDCRLTYAKFNLYQMIVLREFLVIWKYCFKCVARLISEYFICKGCLHVAWCSEACHAADKERHVKGCILLTSRKLFGLKSHGAFFWHIVRS